MGEYLNTLIKSKSKVINFLIENKDWIGAGITIPTNTYFEHFKYLNKREFLSYFGLAPFSTDLILKYKSNFVFVEERVFNSNNGENIIPYFFYQISPQFHFSLGLYEFEEILHSYISCFVLDVKDYLNFLDENREFVLRNSGENKGFAFK